MCANYRRYFFRKILPAFYTKQCSYKGDNLLIDQPDWLKLIVYLHDFKKKSKSIKNIYYASDKN